MGDVDGDGFNDLLVTAVGADLGGSNLGGLWVLYMRGNDTVRDVTRISQATGEGLEGLSGPSIRLGMDHCVLPPRAQHDVVTVVLSAGQDRLLVFGMNGAGEVNSTVSMIADG